MTTMMPVRIVDPVGEALRPPDVTLAPKVDTLNGKAVGFLVNEKGSGTGTDFETDTKLMEERLRRKFQLRDTIRLVKPELTRVAPRPMIEEMAKKADLVITGVGK